MDVNKAFTYVFDDEDWLPKVLIGGVLSIIPIANFIASGYTVQAFRNMAQALERPLWNGRTSARSSVSGSSSSSSASSTTFVRALHN